ncbi:kinase-like protein [Myriangium duriaei CBS 260.36]|uniref:Kinase-like protein n=1 Tax=Myriangium duriaei CBS 260.36 TaxID=1168546 RepID=A0A9P4J243_9PEZI|nr:kinase-like protein [Myriangium duriaei CBS 260.36]
MHRAMYRQQEGPCLFLLSTLPSPPHDYVCLLVPKSRQSTEVLNSRFNDAYKCCYEYRSAGICISPRLRTYHPHVVASIGAHTGKSAIYVSGDGISGLHCEIIIHDESMVFMLKDCSRLGVIAVRQTLRTGEQINYDPNRGRSIVLFPGAATSISLNSTDNVLEFDLFWNQAYIHNDFADHVAMVTKLRDMARPQFRSHYVDTKFSSTDSNGRIRHSHGRFMLSQSPRWQMLHHIGQGAFGDVWLCVNPDSGILMAQKLVELDESNASALRQDAVDHEVEILSLLSHKHILVVLHAFHHGDRYRIFMPAYEGDLSQLLEMERPKPGNGDITLIGHTLFQQLLAALAYMRKQGVVHKDLKPENILYTYDQENQKYRFVISDWGLAVRLPESRAQKGTFMFRSPEQSEDPPIISDKTDIWALCVTMLCVYIPTFYDELEAIMAGPMPHKMREIQKRVHEEAAHYPNLAGMAEFDHAKRLDAAAVLCRLVRHGVLHPDVAAIVPLDHLPFMMRQQVPALPAPPAPPAQSSVDRLVTSFNRSSISRNEDGTEPTRRNRDSRSIRPPGRGGRAGPPARVIATRSRGLPKSEDTFNGLS